MQRPAFYHWHRSQKVKQLVLTVLILFKEAQLLNVDIMTERQPDIVNFTSDLLP